MRNRELNFGNNFDGLTALVYFALVIFGFVNILSVTYDPELPLFSFSLRYTKQLIWIAASVLIIIVTLTIDYRTFETFSYLIYAIIVGLLIFVMLFGNEINGARSWIRFGSFGLQPSEFAKFATALALARYLTQPKVRPERLETKIGVGFIIMLPVVLIVLQGDAGSALVFFSLVLMLYREGVIPQTLILIGLGMAILFVLSLAFPPTQMFYYLILPVLVIALITMLSFKNRTLFKIIITLAISGIIIGFIYGGRLIFDNFLQSHQQERIMVLLDDEVDPSGKGSRYNLMQSLIAIGSGGLNGKGFMNGTQTKLNYVPEQSTDFIFCTIGEEYGWFGSAGMVFLFTVLLYRIVLISERQRDKFVRIYGYSVASIIFIHFALNTAMTIGLFPVIGIPLPLVSYGGSSLWGFTILIFILLKLDAHREQQMIRE